MDVYDPSCIEKKSHIADITAKKGKGGGWSISFPQFVCMQNDENICFKNFFIFKKNHCKVSKAYNICHTP